MIEKQPPVFIILGRFGDCVQLTPCFLEIFRRTGKKPVVIVGREYASVFDGCSYVQPHPVSLHWWKGIPEAKRIAQEEYGGGTVVQFWQEPPKNEDTIGFKGRGWCTLQSHGHEHGVNMALDPNYGTSMARRCGFSQSEWLKLPLVFDRRDPGREAALVNAYTNKRKPNLLFNFAGVSSPFAHTPEVLNVMREFTGAFNLVNLGHIKASRIYDLLGLYDTAVGLITVDTATLHMAPASKIPYCGFTVDGWTSSMCRGNCRLEIKYSQARARLGEVRQWLKGLSEKAKL